MRVLVATTAGEGHFGPIVPFARAAAAAGHEVAVAAPESFAPSVRDADLPHLPFADVPGEIINALMGPLPSLPREEANRVVVGQIFAGVDAEWALPGMRAIFETWRPDVVLRDPCEFASYIVAEGAGVPHVYVATGIAAFDSWARGVVAEPLAALGAPADDAALWDGPRLTMVPASFERPEAPGPSHTRRFAPTAPVTGALPDWWPGDDRPLVYLTFGSVAAAVGFFPGAYRAALDGLADIDARVLVTIGRAGDPGELGTLPPNVRVERWVPQQDVLGHAAALVGHGGFGTTFGAMAAGVPMVVLPLFAGDQFENAERVAAIGAGIGLAGPQDASQVGDALRQVLTDPSFGVAAGRVAKEIADQEALEAFPAHLAEICG